MRASCTRMLVRRSRVDRFSVERLGVVAVAEQGTRTGLDSQRPVGASGAGRLLDPLERTMRALRLAGPNGRLDQLGERPDRRPLRVEALGGQRLSRRPPRIGPGRCKESRSETRRRSGRPPRRVRSPRRSCVRTSSREFGFVAAQSSERQRSVGVPAIPVASVAARSSSSSSAAVLSSPENA